MKLDIKAVEQRAWWLLHFATPTSLVQLGYLHDEWCVEELRVTMGMGEETMAHSIRVLQEDGVITCRRARRKVYCKLTPEAVATFRAVMRLKVPKKD